MFKRPFIIATILLLTGCAGIRFCDKDESPKTGCKAWDPSTKTGAVSK